MARINQRSHRTGPDDRAHWRAGAETWHALLGAVFVMGFLIPALLIGVLTLIETAVSRGRPQLMEQVQVHPAPPSWRPDAQAP
jgi:hypothetical protein